MKKIFSFIACGFLALIALVGCMSFSSSSVKSKLEGKNYSVSVVSADDYKNSSTYSLIKITKDDGFKDLLTAKKDKDGILIFFFDSVDNCDKFREKYQTLLVDVKGFENEGRFGTYNNVAYFGTEDAIDVAGLKLY